MQESEITPLISPVFNEESLVTITLNVRNSFGIIINSGSLSFTIFLICSISSLPWPEWQPSLAPDQTDGAVMS